MGSHPATLLHDVQLGPAGHRLQGDRRLNGSDAFDASERPSVLGYVSPRYRGEAVVAFGDGHTGALVEEELRVMRHWADQATSEDFALRPR